MYECTLIRYEYGNRELVNLLKSQLEEQAENHQAAKPQDISSSDLKSLDRTDSNGDQEVSTTSKKGGGKKKDIQEVKGLKVTLNSVIHIQSGFNSVRM